MDDGSPSNQGLWKKKETSKLDSSCPFIDIEQR